MVGATNGTHAPQVLPDIPVGFHGPVRIVIPGGTGQVGTILARHLTGQGHEVVVLSRGPERGPSAGAPWSVRRWDARTPGPWVECLDGAGVVIQLAGRSVDCRYNAANRRAILDSRVDSTRVLGQALRLVDEPPRVWLQASTATIYAHTFGPAHGEDGVLGGDEPGAPEKWNFSIRVAKAWEAAAVEAHDGLDQTRLVLLRSAMTMSPDPGGVFDVLLGLVRKGLGGRCGSGKQFVSWIHDADFCAAVDWLIAHPEVAGPVNLAAPAPLPQGEFMAALRRAAGVPIGLPAAEWMLEIGARVLRTETELILKSRRVVPERLLAGGFRFRHPEWPAAAQDLVARWRARRRRASEAAAQAAG